mmetsp:Transcript_70413/g.222451  ORF Transcript_70413/g.222451 Transcript_70413/m.222451 type:complete len:698 (+) Transcript_70413:71-2164(+)
MAPRRGGGAGAGAEAVATGAGRNYFEPPPLKRISPWVQDGSSQCDVIAGGVDETGIFKGIYVSGVHLMALLRTFQLSKVFMPCDVPNPVAAIGQDLKDGIPLVIVTRGCFGREMDYGPGPVRNTMQKTIWQTARDMRAEMPQILITTIDIPIDLTSDVLQDIMQPPLNEYRELMYQEGTWYTPEVVNAAPLGKWMAENLRERKSTKVKAKGETHFNRKKFDWLDGSRPFYNMWVLAWKAVMEARPAPEKVRRTDLAFYPGAPKPDSQPIKMPPSVAEAIFKRALAKARDEGDATAMLDATTAYLEKASIKEKESLQEATKACDEADDLFKAKSELTEAFEATKMKFKALVSMGKAEEAMTVATEAFGSASTAELKAQGLKLVVTCHQTLGDLDEAIKAANSGKLEVSKMNDDDATCEALDIVVNACLAQGDFEGAIAAATEATSSKGKVEAAAQKLLATALLAKSAESEVPATAKELAKEAAGALKKAASAYQAQRMSKEHAEALKAAAVALIKGAEFTDAATTAKELEALGNEEKAAGLELVAKALLGSPSATTGGEEEMMTSARSAVALFEELGSTVGKASSQQVLAKALLLSAGDLGEAYLVAKSSAASYKAMGKTEEMCDSLLAAAQAALKKGNTTSAFWEAKQIVSEAPGTLAYDEALRIVGQTARMGEDAGKPIGVGGPVPVNTGDVISYV